MNIAVTGAGGFVGAHLCAHLAACGDRITATDRDAPARDRCQNEALDVTDAAAVDRFFAAQRFDAVLHLAAIAFVPEAERDPATAMHVNVGGTANVLHAVAKHQDKARVLVISSAEVYGAPAAEEMPITEEFAVRPVHAYAFSKWLAEQYARFVADREDIDLLIARPFSHIGPGQRPVFAAASFAKQLAEIAAGRQEPIIRVGDLSAKRDVADVRDVVRAYRLALEKLPNGAVFNVCSGKERAIGDILNDLIELAGIEVRVEVDESRLRAHDIPVIRGAHEYLTRFTGWQPEITWRQTLTDLFQAWRLGEG
ncbi:MAG: NAD-dependent epimerase/dehydratase family protein [Candidatus Lernaella stagnicola]|nr:NAD-dependent epimerase/dehydratase family protein [Candidatus Lernaella stagnicola]